MIATAVAGLAALIALAIWQPWKPAPSSTTPGPKSAASDVLPNNKSIAVLPFENRSDDKDANAFFSDGMHDELLAALAKIGALKVISRTSVLAYRDPAKQRNLRQIAAELGVAHILEGSVSRAGKSVRIIVKLIDAATDEQRWNQTYNLREVTDVFQVQADIAAKIAGSLAAAISPQEKRELAQKLTSNPAAYDLYLRGRRWRELLEPEPRNLAEWEATAVRPLEQAVALDPTFAAAYAELGQIHGYLFFRSYLDPTAARLAKAKAATDEALRLEPQLPEAHLALGNYFYYGFLDYTWATEEYAMVLAARPGDAEVVFYVASLQRRQGRWTDATANIERAFGLNPLRAGVGFVWVTTLLAQRRYHEAERAADRNLTFAPNDKSWIRFKAEARFARDGDRAKLQAVLTATAPSNADPRLAQFGRAFDEERYADAVRIGDEAATVLFRARRYDRLRMNAGRFEYFFAAVASGEGEKARARALARLAETSDLTGEQGQLWVRADRAKRQAMLHAYAGQSDEARRLAERTLELIPLHRDAVDGAQALLDVSRVYLVLGEHDRALALLDQAMSVPNEVSANEILHFEPWWKPLHHDPRFKAALAKAAPRE